MKTNSRSAVARLTLCAVPIVAGLLTTNISAAASASAPQDLPVFLAQTKPADAKAAEHPARTPEEKKRVKSAVILLSILAGIALSGLLLIIASISIHGLQRKLAGPTRLDREPADLFPAMPPRPDLDASPAPVTPPTTDPSSQETRLT